MHRQEPPDFGQRQAAQFPDRRGLLPQRLHRRHRSTSLHVGSGFSFGGLGADRLDTAGGFGVDRVDPLLPVEADVGGCGVGGVEVGEGFGELGFAAGEARVAVAFRLGGQADGRGAGHGAAVFRHAPIPNRRCRGGQHRRCGFPGTRRHSATREGPPATLNDTR